MDSVPQKFLNIANLVLNKDNRFKFTTCLFRLKPVMLVPYPRPEGRGN